MAEHLAIRFWESWLAAAAETGEMFDEPAPGCGNLRQFCGGTRSFVVYGTVFRILGSLAGLSRLPIPDESVPLEASEAQAIFSRVSGMPLRSGVRPFVHVTAGAIRWVWQHLVVPPDAAIGRRKAREIYRCVFARTVRAYAMAYVLLAGGGLGLAAEAKAYAEQARKRQDMLFWLNERYEGKLPRELLPETPGDGTCNAEGYIFGFWLRRYLDGTHRILARYLFEFLKKYDRQFLGSLGLRAAWLVQEGS